MLFKTEGIVLHTVRYGETSVIVRIFTELFGIQSYLVNGVRTSKKKPSKANLLQPAHILDMVVYHREQKNLQRISEFKPAYIYQHLYGNVIKNTIALYITELLYKCLSEPEPHPELYSLSRQSLEWMDKQPAKKLANFPLYFTLNVAGLLGFELYGKYNDQTCYFDIEEGEFVADKKEIFCLGKEESMFTGELLKTKDWEKLPDIKISATTRAQLLTAYLNFLKLHLPGFRELQSPKILKEVLH